MKKEPKPWENNQVSQNFFQRMEKMLIKNKKSIKKEKLQSREAEKIAKQTIVKAML